MKTNKTFYLFTFLSLSILFLYALLIRCFQPKSAAIVNLAINTTIYDHKIDSLYLLLRQKSIKTEPQIHTLLQLVPSQYIHVDTLHSIANFYYYNADVNVLYYPYQAILYLNKEIENRKLNGEIDTTKGMLSNYCMLGIAHFNIKRIEMSQQYLAKTDTIIKKRNNPNDSNLLVSYYRTLANIADYYNNFTSAVDYLQLALKNSSDANDKADIYNELGIIAKKNKEYNKAIKYYNKALQYNYFQGVYVNLAIAYDSLRKGDSLLFFINKAVNKYAEEKDTIQLINCYNIKAKHYINENKFKEAEQYYQKSFYLLKYIQPQKNYYISETYEGLSFLAQYKQQFDTAIQLCQKSINALFLNDCTKDILVPPSVSRLQNELIGEPKHILKLLAIKSDILIQLYQKTNIEEYKQAALQYFALTDSLYKVFSLSYQGEEGDLNLYESSHLFYEKAFRFTLHQGQQKQALHYFDAAKSIALRKQINYKILKDKYIKNKNILYEEMELENNTILLRKEYVKNPDNIIIKKAFVEASIRSEAFKKQLLIQYPKYKQAVESLINVPIGTPKMADKQALITYFMGQDSLYIVAQSNELIKFFSKAIPTHFERKLNAFIASYSRNELNTVMRQDTFCHYSNLIYNILLYEPLTFLNEESNIHRICIIPDGILHQLNFAILTQQPVERWIGSRNYKIPFVMRDYAISYETSQTLWEKQQQKSYWNIFKHDISFSIFGLSYQDSLSLKSNQNKELNPLPYIKEEIQQIQRILPNVAIYSDITNIQTTKTNFLRVSQHSDVIHFSGHAYADSINPLYSGMFFSKENVETNNILTSDDITTHHFTNTKMVFLNACQTNYGKLNKQEGMLHLARAFRLAGANTVVGTQWQVQNDVMTTIIPKFYQILLSGQTKDIALQQAQQAYIDTQLDASPDKWAAIIISGDTQVLSSKLSISYYLVLFILFDLGYLLFFKKR
jgi:CHAT domain-containing protein